MRILSLLLLLLSTNLHAYVADLNNTSLLTIKDNLPEGRLVFMEIIDGMDPFDFFKGTLAPSYNFPLIVEKKDGRLQVEIGKKVFVQSEFFVMSVLADSKSEFRLSVTTVIMKTAVRQFIINVDRPFKNARVLMREFNGTWSEWKPTADYAGLW